MVKKNVVAIIPARGGSKRIPKKNIIDFNGKPLIAWTIEAALKSALFSVVIVSTDDEDIANVARSYGAIVPFLRNNHCDDFSPVSEATINCLENLEKLRGETFTTVVQLMPNCPLRDENVIVSSFSHFEATGAKSQISSFKFGWMNPWWAATIDDFGKPTSLFEKEMKSRSQDLPDLYCPTGAIWISQRDILVESKTFYSPGYTYCAISWKEAVDIDNYEDLEFAKVLSALQF